MPLRRTAPCNLCLPFSVPWLSKGHCCSGSRCIAAIISTAMMTKTRIRPITKASGYWGVVRGLWHSHLGWMFASTPPDLQRYVRDLRQSKLLRAASALFPLWVAVGLLIPTALGWLLIGTPSGAWTGFVWGGLVRILFVHHVTWSINSVCHVWGSQPYHSNDQSRNNALFGIFGMGEGWHNTHHAFPTSARHGLRWWQFDLSYWVIRGLELIGLAWNVKLPSRAALARGTRL